MAKTVKKVEAVPASSPSLRIPLANVVIDYAFNVRSKTTDADVDTGKTDKDGKPIYHKEKGYRAVAELAADIKANGQLQPVIVRPLADGKYFLIAGFRRMDALKSLGAEFVDAKIEPGDDLRAYLLNIKENVNRDDLTTYDIAIRCTLLRDRFKLEVTQISKELAGGTDYKGEGMSAGYIRNLMRAADGLHPKILADWKVSRIPTDKVVRWAAMEKDEQINEWEDWRGGKEPSEGNGEDKESKSSGPSGKKIKRASEALLRDAIKAVQASTKLGETAADSMLAALYFALGKAKTLRLGQTVVYDPVAEKKRIADERKAKKETAQAEKED